MGEFNAQIGSDNTGREQIMGKHAIGRMTENGRFFTEACGNTNLLIGGTLFPHRKVHKITTWRSSILDVRSKRGADCNSDHHLVFGSLRIRVAAIRKPESTARRYDIAKLKDPQTLNAYREELRAGLAMQQSHPSSEWPTVKSNFVDASSNHIGLKVPRKTHWMSNATWNLILERKAQKEKLNAAKTFGEKSSLKNIYAQQDKLVKRSARNYKRMWYNKLASDAQKASAEHRSKDLYSITKKLTGRNFSNTRPLRNAEGELTTSARE
ncbi:craniofacial development protein 2-like [Calliphora vicina]|uniref:craniofacial development protein 2-like n=1 Tax=Calliphora vicina TaxID=7373 RepID=UPI00325B0B6D